MALPQSLHKIFEEQPAMKFTAESETLATVLADVARFLPKQTHIAAFRGIRLRLEDSTLHISGGDTEAHITTQIEVNGKKNGDITVDRSLSNIMHAALPGSVILSANSKGAVTIGGSSDSEWHLQSIADDQDQLNIPDSQTQASVSISAGELLDRLQRVLTSASRDDSRPLLCGVNLAIDDTGVTMAATDSYRLAVHQDPDGHVDGEGTATIPAPALKALTHLLGRMDEEAEILLEIGERHARFEVGDNTVLTVALTAGKFPAYKSLIPALNSKPVLTLELKDLEATLKRIADPISAHHVRFNVGSEKSHVLAVTEDRDGPRAEEPLHSYTLDGDDVETAFACKYLTEGLNTLQGSDQITYHSLNPEKPVVLTGSDPNFLYLIMPVKYNT